MLTGPLEAPGSPCLLNANLVKISLHQVHGYTNGNLAQSDFSQAGSCAYDLFQHYYARLSRGNYAVGSFSITHLARGDNFSVTL